MAATRNQQPTFNLLTGEASTAGTTRRPSLGPQQSSIPAPPSSATKRRLSTTTFTKSALPLASNGAPVRATIDNEALRAALNTAEYNLSTTRSEAALALESSRAEIRDLERRVESEARRAAEAEKRREDALRRLEAVVAEGRDAATRAENEKRAAELKVRKLVDEVGEVRGEAEDAREEIAGLRREMERERGEAEGRNKVLEGRVEELEGVLGQEKRGAESFGSRAKEAERRAAELEEEVVRLRAERGDVDMLAVVKRELGEQVGYVKKLEVDNGKLEREVKRLGRERKAVEVVEEEKRTLEGKLRLVDDVRRELAESELRRRVLEDERQGWSAYLENEQAGFDSPEEMARAFVKERAERVQLLEQLGRIQPELAVKDEAIASLEHDRSRLETELKKMRSSGGGAPGVGVSESKMAARLERQRNLAVKEVAYLRAQLRSLEDVTTEFEDVQKDQQASEKNAELELLVDEYKVELSKLHTQLSQLESQAQAAPKTPLKRSHDEATPEAEDERLGTLRRKLRTMTTTLSDLETTNVTLSSDLKATKTQLSALRSSTRTRALELRDNPTAQHAIASQQKLRALEESNAALLSQLSSSAPASASVPVATLDALRLKLSEKDAELAQRDKKATRLKTIWAAKAAEFREAIKSTLGWDVVFMPGGKTRLSSIYYPKRINEETGEEEENFILFDGENGTMKISGGEKSAFARELREMVEFWVEGKAEVPGFLAAAALEFLEKKRSAV